MNPLQDDDRMLRREWTEGTSAFSLPSPYLPLLSDTYIAVKTRAHCKYPAALFDRCGEETRTLAVCFYCICNVTTASISSGVPIIIMPTLLLTSRNL